MKPNWTVDNDINYDHTVLIVKNWKVLNEAHNTSALYESTARSCKSESYVVIWKIKTKL